MFPKMNRLHLRGEKEFFKKAKRKSGSLFQLFWMPNETLDPAMAVIVPKKVSLKSTDRHKVLRRMRQAMIHQQEVFKGKKVVAVMFHQSLGKTVKELEEGLQKLTNS